MITFAGDGILALWSYENSVDKGSISSLAHMAVQCSLYLHQQLDNFQMDVTSSLSSASVSLSTSGSSRTPLYIYKTHNTTSAIEKDTLNENMYIKTHTGLGYGEVKIYYVGGVNDRWSYVVAGNAVEQLTTTVAQAESGQVVVSPQLWEVVHHYCVGRIIGEKSEINKSQKGKKAPVEVRDPII